MYFTNSFQILPKKYCYEHNPKVFKLFCRSCGKSSGAPQRDFGKYRAGWEAVHVYCWAKTPGCASADRIVVGSGVVAQEVV